MTISKLVAGQKGSPTNSKGGNVADAVNALIDKNPKDLNLLAFQLSTIQPTVTVSAAGASTSIPNSVRIQPAKSPTDATKFHVEGDPNFRIIGVPSSKTLVNPYDIMRAEHLTGGSSQAARWRPYVEFSHVGQRFEILIQSTGVDTEFRLWVNGRPLTSTTQNISTTTNARHRILVDFGTIGARDIRFEMFEFSFGGVFVEPFGSITSSNYKKKKMAFIGDSFCSGSYDATPFESWPWLASNYLGMDCINLAIGGSGFIAAPNFQSRLQDVIDANPDYLVVSGGWNDLQGNTTQVIMAAFNTFVGSVVTALPNCKIIVCGVHMNNHNDYPAATALEVALRDAADQLGYVFVSQRDPLNIVSTLPAWTNGVEYKFGDLIKQYGLPWTCHTDHMSAGSFDTTKFRCSALFSGTGRVGSIQNNGSLDICLSSDTIHFTTVGMMIQGLSYAEQIHSKLD